MRTVHHLRHGVAACVEVRPDLRCVPRDWPPDNVWSADWSEVDCGNCLAARDGKPMLHNPGGLGFRIKEIYALVAVHDDNDEGVVGVPTNSGGTMPLVMADDARLDSLRPMFPGLAQRFGRTLRLVKFTTREEIEVFEPEKPPS